jgi:cytochrome c oxidase subunit 1
VSAAAPALGALRSESPAIARERVTALVVRYVLTSSAIFLVAGALGGLLRQSQAHLAVIDPKAWYAIMTAHGLAAFVGWAAFALMGVTFWVLEECGFPLRKSGLVFAEASYWAMVAGVTGVVITTLALGFGGSWVFLYPLPFDSAAQWSEMTTGIFAFSVLLVGVSILAYCAGVLATVTSIDTHERGGGLGARLGNALGFGYLSPRFQTRRTPTAYPVIPLTVIAIDMIIATLPFAALLVEMIVQSIDPSVGISPLLAKSVLWWFGHPVVYLLLFPAVGIYYHLVPHYCGRSLVAGHVIVWAWVLAVIVNVIIGAHHMYLDFPQGSLQPLINTMMQPLTFAIVTPSALSLYSLSATMYRSDVQWTVPMQFLFVGMLSWLIAGLQGVINATISLDLVVHNTLWIVGHFHNMALLNIGLVIFAAIYAYVPDLVGRPWHSERLGRWHLWLTVIGGYGMVVPWLAQGLDGAPRRWAVLPGRYDSMTDVALPFVLMVAVGQAVFAYNLLRTLGSGYLRSLPGPPLEATPERGSDVLGTLIAAPAPVLAIAAVYTEPFLFAPIAILLGMAGYALGARRLGVASVVMGFAGLALGFLLTL